MHVSVVRRIIGRGLILVGLLASATLLGPFSGAAAGPHTPAKAVMRGDAERGRAVFNGKGICHYCHGVDGHREQRPALEPDTAALIARLNPPPPDLRNPKTLRLADDGSRAHVIREGHPGTGMFPDTTMTDQDLADVVAYLAQLRSAGAGRSK